VNCISDLGNGQKINCQRFIPKQRKFFQWTKKRIVISAVFVYRSFKLQRVSCNSFTLFLFTILNKLIMLVKDLNTYVKFVFLIENSESTFVTSDISVLKEVVSNSAFNIGDIVEIDNLKVKITNIQLKHIDENTRSNSTGFNMNESPMQDELKDSVLTVVITTSEQLP
jgi:hypothetical protein